MISKEEIKKLADLARIDIKDEEIEGLRGEMDAILDYVGQVKSVTGDFKENTEIGILFRKLKDNPAVVLRKIKFLFVQINVPERGDYGVRTGRAAVFPSSPAH